MKEWEHKLFSTPKINGGTNQDCFSVTSVFLSLCIRLLSLPHAPLYTSSPSPPPSLCPPLNSYFSPPYQTLFLHSPPPPPSPALMFPSSTWGVEHPSVFKMKRWLVCRMWCLLSCFMSQGCLYICSIYTHICLWTGWWFTGSWLVWITGVFCS